MEEGVTSIINRLDSKSIKKDVATLIPIKRVWYIHVHVHLPEMSKHFYYKMPHTRINHFLFLMKLITLKYCLK